MTSCACGLIEAVTSVHADAWSAIAQWVTVVIAGGAAWFAAAQVIEARRTREEVAQPNVVVFADFNQVKSQFVDLVIKNFGQTSAYDIIPDIEPLERISETDATDGIGSVYLPSKIVVLAPGQEWRTVWDSVVSRSEYETVRKLLPQVGLRELKDAAVASGQVTYSDVGGKVFENPVRLDFSMFHNAIRIKE